MTSPHVTPSARRVRHVAFLRLSCIASATPETRAAVQIRTAFGQEAQHIRGSVRELNGLTQRHKTGGQDGLPVACADRPRLPTRFSTGLAGRLRRSLHQGEGLRWLVEGIAQAGGSALPAVSLFGGAPC